MDGQGRVIKGEKGGGGAISNSMTADAGGTVRTVVIGEVNVSAAARRIKLEDQAHAARLVSNGNTFGGASAPARYAG
jgi:hypothetical protein